MEIKINMTVQTGIVDRDYLDEIVFSTSDWEQVFDRLMDALRLAKTQGMTQDEAASLLDSFCDDPRVPYSEERGAKNELYETIMSIIEVVVGYCSPTYRIWDQGVYSGLK